ncbi:MAG: hypothetical protein PVF29_08055 [Desulfobacterales bacterium]|jgi:hypothetical protein
MNKVENLKKVTLRIEAGTNADHMDLTLEALEFEFIFGIGPDGMCPFEYELVNKKEGDIVLLHLKKEEVHLLLGHLQLPVQSLLEENDSSYLKATIAKIEQPDSKEVVKALAELTSHAGDRGCGCGSGCGC